MARLAHQTKKMKAEKSENPSEKPTAQTEIAPAENEATSEDFASELNEPHWSVITFDTIASSGLTYDEAFEHLRKLEAEKVSGLCIVTDEAAKRIAD